jgi:hypothetical protein
MRPISFAFAAKGRRFESTQAHRILERSPLFLYSTGGPLGEPAHHSSMTFDPAPRAPLEIGRETAPARKFIHRKRLRRNFSFRMGATPHLLATSAKKDKNTLALPLL